MLITFEEFLSLAIEVDSYNFNFFSGTGNGRVIKAINSFSASDVNQVKTIIVEELQVFSLKTIIKDLKVSF